MSTNNPAIIGDRFAVSDEIIFAIEQTGALSDEFDLDQIADRCFSFSPEHQSFVTTTSIEDFWAEVDKAALPVDEGR